MDTRTLARLLAATPAADLSIIELTAELTRPDGTLDLEAAAARQKDVETGLRPGPGLRLGHWAAQGGAAVATAAPALLSGLAQLLLRRPPSLRELVTIVGYADDYAWFAELVRRLFPNEAEAALSAPDVRTRVERFANLFGERHFPLYMPVIDFWTEMEGEEPPWSWLRRGIPFDLMGFGYDGLHEMWNGYRDGISALLLLARPPDSFYGESDEIRVAWLESAAERIPQQTLERIPRGGIPVETLTEAVKGTRFEGAAKAASWVFAETGNFFLDHSYEDGSYDGFADPWEDEIIAEGTEEWCKASALMDSVCKLADWLEEDLPGRFAEMLDTILPRLPEQEQEQEESDHEQRTRHDPVVPAGPG